MRKAIDLLWHLAAVAAVLGILFVLFTMLGCGAVDGFRRFLGGALGLGPSVSPKAAPDAIVEFARTLSHIARWLAIGAILAIVGSYAPVAGPFLAPARRTAAIGFGLSFGVATAGYLFGTFGKPIAIGILIVGLVGGGFTLWPYVRGLFHGAKRGHVHFKRWSWNRRMRKGRAPA